MSLHVVIVDYLQVFGVFVVLPPLFLLLWGSVGFDKMSQHSYFFMQVFDEVEVIELPLPQLTVVVVETLLGHPYHCCSFLKVDSPFDDL